MTLYGPGAKKLAKVLGILGGVGFLICVLWTGYESVNTASLADCRAELSALPASGATADDEKGALRIVDVRPQTVHLSGRLCLLVAGVATKATDTQTDADSSRSPVEIALFLNDRRLPQTIKAAATPRPQILVFEFGQTIDATSDEGKFWRGLLAGHTKNGVMQIRVGVAKSASGTPEAIAAKSVEFLVYLVPILALGGLSMALLVAAFIIFAANSTVLRDSTLTIRNSPRMAQARAALAAARTDLNADQNDATRQARFNEAEATVQALQAIADQPAGTFSLGRTQMALWLGLATAGFVFLWLTLGFYLNVITSSILVLLGINGATGLAAAVMDQPVTAGAAPAQTQSKSFFSDLMYDGDGPKLQRIQMAIWSCILAVIFVWNAIANFVFVEFDTYLLLLMGIANSTYLGFKTQEKPKTT